MAVLIQTQGVEVSFKVGINDKIISMPLYHKTIIEIKHDHPGIFKV